MKTRFTSLVEGQDQLARGIESLPDSEARDAYRALLIVVHQLRRVKLGQGKPSALDDPDTLADSFEDYSTKWICYPTRSLAQITRQ